MKYQVSKMADLHVVKTVETENYNDIIIPIDICHLEKIIKGDIKFDFLSAELQQKLLESIKIDDFKAKCGEVLWASEIKNNAKTSIMLRGVGDCKCEKTCQKLKFLTKMENLGGKLVMPCFKKLLIVGDFITTPSEYHHSKMISAIALGFLQSSYRFDKYMTTEKNKAKSLKLEQLSVFISNAKNIDIEIENVKNILESLYFVRDLVNEPGNVIYPDSYANIVKENMHSLGNLTIKILGIAELEKLGMNLLLGVGLGSRKESRVVLLEYKGDSAKFEIDVAFVGKGVTFDSGGISIKPAKGMEDMKGDMAGSAAVVGTMKLLATRKAKVNAVGVIGLVENMPDGLAQRPGDIVKSMSGQTVEVINTDAEGRLVLGDILYYSATTYKPKYMIDLATLTGAVTVALGTYYAGMYSTSDEFADMLSLASKKTGEDVWRMPLDERFDKMINSKFADMANSTNMPYAGSITAAQFLKRFIGETENWIHLDIAGVSDVSVESNIAQKSCSTAFGVKLLNQFVIDNIEKN